MIELYWYSGNSLTIEGLHKAWPSQYIDLITSSAAGRLGLNSGIKGS